MIRHGLLAASAALLWLTAGADVEFDCIRTQYAYCTDGAGNVLSRHETERKAYFACGQRALNDPGGEYRVSGSECRIALTGIAEAEAGVVVVESEYPAAQFGAPPLYSSFVSNIVAECETSSNHFTTGDSNVVSGTTYRENGTHTVFYAAAEGLWRCQDWATRTGNALTLNAQGVQNALQVYMRRHNTDAFFTNARLRSCEVPYYAIAGINGVGQNRQFPDSDTLATGPLRAVDNSDLLNCIQNGFNYNSLNEYDMGPQGDIGVFGVGTYTTRSRQLAYWGAGLVYWERNGNPPYVDPDTGDDALPWAILMNVNQLHRWRNEQYGTFGVVQNRTDSGAHFMVALNVKFAYEYIVDSFANGVSPDRHMPNLGAQAVETRLSDGDYFSDPVGDHTLILSPWTVEMGPTQYAIINQLVDVLNWQYAPIDWTWTAEVPDAGQLDTRVPAQSALDTRLDPAPSYMRVLTDHTGDEPRSRGDPMLIVRNEGHVDLLGRTGPGPNTQPGQDANNYSNIQLLNVHALWCTAKLLNDLQADAETRDRFIRWGDLIWRGAVFYGTHGTQRARNQFVYYGPEALDCRNSVTGRND